MLTSFTFFRPRLVCGSAVGDCLVLFSFLVMVLAEWLHAGRRKMPTSGSKGRDEIALEVSEAPFNHPTLVHLCLPAATPLDTPRAGKYLLRTLQRPTLPGRGQSPRES
jgi:hypothetical protein